MQRVPCRGSSIWECQAKRLLKCQQEERGDKERQFDWSTLQIACAEHTLVAQHQMHEGSQELYESSCSHTSVAFSTGKGKKESIGSLSTKEINSISDKTLNSIYVPEDTAASYHLVLGIFLKCHLQVHKQMCPLKMLTATLRSDVVYPTRIHYCLLDSSFNQNNQVESFFSGHYFYN